MLFAGRPLCEAVETDGDRPLFALSSVYDKGRWRLRYARRGRPDRQRRADAPVVASLMVLGAERLGLRSGRDGAGKSA
jgi:hypothetical protein